MELRTVARPLALALGLLALTAVPLGSAQQPPECNLKPPSSSVTINVVGFRFPMTEYYAKAMENCSKVQNVKVTSTFLPIDAFGNQIGTALAGGGSSPYQIIQINQRLMSDWGGKGWLLPLDTFIAKYRKQYNLDDIGAGLWANGKLNGRTYGIPVNFNTQIIFYRKDVFDELGLKPPKTLAEYNQVLDALAKGKKTRYPAALAMGGTQLFGEFYNNLVAFGGRMFDAKDRPVFNSEAGVKAAEALASWLPYMPPSVLSYSNDDVMVGLQQGDVAMSKIWVTRANAMDDPSVSRVVGKIQYAPAFKVTSDGYGATTAGGDMYAIAANPGVDRDLVFRVLMEALDRRSQLEASKFGMVSRDSIANNPDIIKANRSWPAAAQNGVIAGPNAPSKPYLNIATGVLNTTLAKALAEKGDLKAALDAAARQVEQEMKSQGFLR